MSRAMLEVDYLRLVYHLYISPPSSRYTSFNLTKRRGGFRTIAAPVSSLKILERKLATILELVYDPRSCVCGFVVNKGIVDNAIPHLARAHVLNVDILDYFPSINFGRVRGLFMARPYSLPANVSTVLAQICCFNNQLPQGAPTSPIVSNMICARLDFLT